MNLKSVLTWRFENSQSWTEWPDFDFFNFDLRLSAVRFIVRQTFWYSVRNLSKVCWTTERIMIEEQVMRFFEQHCAMVLFFFWSSKLQFSDSMPPWGTMCSVTENENAVSLQLKHGQSFFFEDPKKNYLWWQVITTRYDCASVAMKANWCFLHWKKTCTCQGMSSLSVIVHAHL